LKLHEQVVKTGSKG